MDNTDSNRTSGIILIISLTLLAIILNALVFYIILYSLKRLGRWIISILFVINAIALYFVNTYNVILDKTMIGNVYNTNFEEASSFWSFSLLVYVILLGVIPSIFILKVKFQRTSPKKFFTQVGATLLFLVLFAYANSSNWLWIDRHSTELGAVVMPWSYIVNSVRYFSHEHKMNKKQIKLPDASIKDTEKRVVVLAIGESARKANFSLYGYKRPTNPLLSGIDRLKVYEAESAATYTTAGVKAMLEHKETNKLYEILPNYLFRTGVDVIWRTTNWGEPTVRIDKYLTKKELALLCDGEDKEYDEILLCGLKQQILQSGKDKIFVVLHMSTSHGPTYYKKYPKRFNQFTPVCKSVVLDDCTQTELVNAYDNTILYTDYLIATLIKELSDLEDYKASMLFVSDHGESLGEKNLYMHGVPIFMAPKEQYEIPFIVWSSSEDVVFKDVTLATQHHVFHTVMDLLGVQTPVYDPTMTLIAK